jgi:hypothetical protein
VSAGAAATLYGADGSIASGTKVGAPSNRGIKHLIGLNTMKVYGSVVI